MSEHKRFRAYQFCLAGPACTPATENRPMIKRAGLKLTLLLQMMMMLQMIMMKLDSG